MSDFTAILLMMALAAVSVFIYQLIDKWFHDRTHTIAHGVVEGVPISGWYRRMLLHTTWLGPVGVQIGFQAWSAIGWMLIARNASAEEVQLFAYLLAFMASLAVLSWVGLAPFWYLRLASALRQAEAD